MKKIRYILILIVILVLILFFYIPRAPEDIREMVTSEQKSYNAIAESVYENYLSVGKGEQLYYVSYGREIVSSEDGSYEREYSIVTLNEEDMFSGDYVKVDFLLCNKEFYYIRAYDGFVSFCDSDGYASIVYSVDGARPRHVTSASENFDKICCYKISDNWYYVEEGYYYYESLAFRMMLFVTEWWYAVAIVIIVLIIFITIMIVHKGRYKGI